MENEKKQMDIYINGIPKLELIPKELKDGLIAMLELEITDYYKTAEKEEK